MSEKYAKKKEQYSAVAPACPGGQLYTIKSGDTLFMIAQSSNVSLQGLIDANPQINDPNRIFPGQVICIPGMGPAPVPVPSPGPGLTCPNGQVYVVVPGDTMFDISQRFGTSLDDLIGANPQIQDPNIIYPGEQICIPQSMPVLCPNGTIYVVQSGDTMWDIAGRNNISLDDLIDANPQIADPNVIDIGQEICIPSTGGVIVPPLPIAPPAPAPCPMPTYPQLPIAPPAPAPCPMPIAPPMPMPCPPRAIAPPMPMPCPPRAIAPPMPMPCPQRPMAPPIPTPYSQMPLAPMTACPQLPVIPRKVAEPSKMMYPYPVYVVVPWDECPYRPKKKKDRHHHHCCK